ncbi:MAG: FtsH protease activity modulator HflK [Chromatiaceae bacterium]|nr:FtsH protease activity modulator HflK [Gammaproteobacteria bacterium]MCP5301111.1 FtsH protease activity modulator HflK [Chromatiaceae bacterium]MCP5421417.1 FtsH protease activity modulator HflK [Chromatiaceae bacterium]
MAWNEPGGGNRDPWNNKGGDQGPPDLDEVVRKLQDKMGGLFGGKRRRGGGGGDDGERVPGGPGKKGVGVIIALVLVVVLSMEAFYIVQPAERGVVKRFGAYHTVTSPGPHLKLPFVDTVDVVNVDQVNKIQHRAQMLTKDENIADVTLEVQFRIQDAADFLFQDANPGGTIHGAMESSLREVIGKSKLDEIITENRSGIAVAVQQGTQQLLDLYRTGLIVTNVNIQRAEAPEAVAEAFADAIRAREDKERLQNQAQTYANDVVPRARGEAARLIEDAKGYKARMIAEADGESQRFLALLGEYKKAPQVTRERLYLETMQDVLKNTGKVLLDVKEGSNLTYLPLDRMIQPGGKRNTEYKPPESPRIALPQTDGTRNSTPLGDRRAYDRTRRER